MMRKGILVLNAGSSSIKFLFFAAQNGTLDPHIRGQIEGIHTSPRFLARDPQGRVVAEKNWGDGADIGHDGAVAYLADFLRGHADGFELEAVGHRVVHGGPRFAQPVRLDRGVLSALEALVPLAPLHQPHNLTPIRMLLERRPELPQVACFDTAFHTTNPEIAQRFAIPGESARRRRPPLWILTACPWIRRVLPVRARRARCGRPGPSSATWATAPVCAR